MSTLTISSFQLNPQAHFNGSTCWLRITYSAEFIASDGTTVLGSPNYYSQIQCTISSGIITVPSFTMYCTSNSQTAQNVTVTGVIYDQSFTRQNTLWSQWTVPQSMSPSATYAQWSVYNAAPTLSQPVWQYLNRDQTIALIQSYIGTNAFATTTVAGITRLDVAPVTSTIPIAVGSNSFASLSHLGITELDTAPSDPMMPIAVGVNSSLLVPVNASSTVKGVTKLSKDPVSSTAPIAVGVNDSNYGYNLTAFGVPCDGVTNATSALVTLLTAIGSTQARLVFPSSGHCLLSNITIPGNITLDFTSGGSIKVVTGQTAHIQGPVLANATQQVFFNVLPSQGILDMFSSNTSLSEVYLEWLGSTSAGDWSGALASLTTGFGGATPVVLVINQSMTFNGTFTVPSFITLKFVNSGRFFVNTGLITILGPLDIPLNYRSFSLDNGLSFTGNQVLNKVYSEWWGAVPNNSTDCASAIQAAQDCLSQLTAGTLYFSTGTYNVSRAIVLLEVKGITWQGTGRINCVIRATGTDSAVQGNGVWYSKFISIQFTTINALSGKGVFELDGNYDTVHTQGVQANTFIDCLFTANGSDYALANVRRGGSSGQGSENLWLNCHFNGASIACYFHSGFNAIANTFIGGDMQGYPKDGIHYSGGSVNVIGTSFESTYGYTQVINDGYDISTGGFGAYETSIIQGCRTESLRFFRGSTAQFGSLRGVTYVPAAAYTWTAGGVVALNTVIFKTTAGGVVNMYRVTTAGISGGSEPTWPNTGTIADGSAIWTVTAITVVVLGGSESNISGYIGFQFTELPGNLASIDEVGSSKNITANYTASSSDDILLCNATSGNILVVLPVMPNDKVIRVKKVDTTANTVTVAGGAGSNGIDLGSSYIIPGNATGWLEVIYSDVSGLGQSWWTTGRSFQPNKAGAALTVTSNTIAPVLPTHQVGAGLIKTITTPSGFVSGNTITLIPTAAFTTDATDNIAIVSTAVVGRALTMTLVGATWYPSY